MTEKLQQCFGTYDPEDGTCLECEDKVKCEAFTAFLQKGNKSASKFLIIKEDEVVPLTAPKVG